MRTIEWHDGIILAIDQTRLPNETIVLKFENCSEIVDAIKTMKLRGAPLLGVAAGFALALTAYRSKAANRDELIRELERGAEVIRATRPTAVNLFWALDRILGKARAIPGNEADLVSFVIEEAKRIADEDVAANHQIGKHGSKLVQDGDVILTHCNAGALATVDYGTALGIVRAAVEQGKRINVIATETRPLLQGARLTTYELKRDGIEVTLVTDGMIGYLMYKRMINKVIVGADRIVRDAVINKIGTFTVSVLAKEHKIPFYVAAPTSTFDFTRTAESVVIEERNPVEVTHIESHSIAAEGIKVFNPAFDITPLKYVTAIICENGVLGKTYYRKFSSQLL